MTSDANLAGFTASFNSYYGNKAMLVIALVSCAFLLITSKRERKRLVIPLLFILIAVLNPFFYGLTVKVGIYWYWRFLWMFAEGIVSALAMTRLIRSVDDMFLKPIFFTAFCVLFVMCGTYAFNSNSFSPARSLEKLRIGTMAVCDVILEVDESPHVVMCYTYAADVRQYSGDIMLYFDRYAYEDSWRQSTHEWKMCWELEQSSPDYDYIFDTAFADGFNFVVTYGSRPVAPGLAENYGYEEIGDESGVVIWYNETVTEPID